MPRTSRPLQIHPIVLRRARVERIADLTPNMRRLTLTGEELSAGVMGEGHPRPAFRSDGFDDHIKMVFPPSDDELPEAGEQQATTFSWNREVFAFTRDYTVRSWDPETGALDVDVVRHDHGLAADWAFRAQPGDEISFAGPKSCALVSEGVDWHLLAGDETALPAIGRFLEEAPAGARGLAIVEVPTLADRQEIETASDIEVRWIARDGIPAGQSTLLYDAVREVAFPEGERVYAWVGGESMSIAPIRRHLRGERGLPKEDVEVVGYWRRPRAVDAAPAEEGAEAPERGSEDESALALLHEAHELGELAPAIVTRVAVTLGIGPLVAGGADDLPALARETGITPELLAPLVDAMLALGILERDGERVRNTALGGVFMEDAAIDELSLDNPANRDALALVGLLDVLRGSGGETATWRGRRAADPALEAAYDERAADRLQYAIGPLTSLPALRDARVVAVLGDGAAYVAAQLGETRTVVLPAADAVEWPAHDAAILIGALEGRDDDEARTILRAALAGGAGVVLAEPTSDGAAEDDHVAERALTSLALTGAPLRAGADLERLAREAGAQETRTTTLGWGFGPYGAVLLAR
ncbi:SIP domain-containing protein [Microbacterium sp. gxy059]|uniref:SIP domain-containing protein n=1 Tax=Microbacterium sp. gxy059 TaxID=2957199 RepID=UPI003D98CFC8